MNAPECPKCGKEMRLRHRKTDQKPFYGCSDFPRCDGLIGVETTSQMNTGTVNQNQKAVQNMIDMAKGKIVKKAFVPSSYQKAIFEWVKGDGKALVVKALAGSGKTTTGIKMLDFVDASKEIVYLAFNKHIAEELKTRVAPHVKVMTYHALGYAAVRQAFGNNVKIDNEKVRKLLENYLDKYVQRSLFSPLEHLVSLVKGNMTGTSPEDLQYLCDRYNIELNGDMALAFQIVPMVVARSLEMTSVIDFDDKCYFPVALNLKAKQYDFLFVDEAQDTNKCQIALALMSMKDDGRIVAVGDEYQSIYGFRGADVDAIPNLIDFLHAETLPLSVTYRCPKTHVDQISKMFPEIGLESSDSGPLPYRAFFPLPASPRL